MTTQDATPKKSIWEWFRSLPWWARLLMLFLVLGITILDMLVPDMLPFVDEALLTITTVIMAINGFIKK